MNSHYHRPGNVHTLQANSIPPSSSEIILQKPDVSETDNNAGYG